MSHKTNILIIGPTGSGKTTLAHRLTRKEYVKNIEKPEGDDILYRKTVKDFTLRVLVATNDIELRSEFRRMTINSAFGFVFTFDMNDAESFKGMKKMMDDVRVMLGGYAMPCIIVGTKMDKGKRVVDPHDVMHLSDTYEGCACFDVSAKSGKNVKTAFKYLLDVMPLPSSLFKITVHSGKELQSKDVNGFSDPFFTAAMGKDEFYRSTVLKETLSPRWKESFVCNAADDINISIWDRDVVGTNDYMGSIILTPSIIMRGAIRKKFYIETHGKYYAEKVSGFLKISIKYKPDGGNVQLSHKEPKKKKRKRILNVSEKKDKHRSFVSVQSGSASNFLVEDDSDVSQ